MGVWEEGVKHVIFPRTVGKIQHVMEELKQTWTNALVLAHGAHVCFKVTNINHIFIETH